VSGKQKKRPPVKFSICGASDDVCSRGSRIWALVYGVSKHTSCLVIHFYLNVKPPDSSRRRETVFWRQKKNRCTTLFSQEMCGINKEQGQVNKRRPPVLGNCAGVILIHKLPVSVNTRQQAKNNLDAQQDERLFKTRHRNNELHSNLALTKCSIQIVCVLRNWHLNFIIVHDNLF
jgi:hypothetical protein